VPCPLVLRRVPDPKEGKDFVDRHSLQEAPLFAKIGDRLKDSLKGAMANSTCLTSWAVTYPRLL